MAELERMAATLVSLVMADVEMLETNNSRLTADRIRAQLVITLATLTEHKVRKMLFCFYVLSHTWFYLGYQHIVPIHDCQNNEKQKYFKTRKRYN